MFTKNLLALSLAAALGVSMTAAYADYDHPVSHDYRNDHRDARDDHRDHRESSRDRHERERREEFARHEYRGPRGYAVAAPVYVSPPVYAPPSLNIVVPITLP